MAALRVAELNREFTDRYGGEILPSDDAGSEDVAIMLHHLARRPDPARRMGEWLDRRAPWLVGGEREALVEHVLANPFRFKADTLAAKIGLTAERRALLRITTIGAIDCNKEERAERRRQAKVERERVRRATKRAERVSSI